VRRKINMNNLKKAGVMALVALFTISMVLVPFTPTTQIQPVAAPDYTTPEDVMMDIERYVDTQKEGGPLGSILASYRDTGYVPNTVSRNDAGDVGLLVTVRSESDVASLEEIIDVNWKVEIGAMTIANGFVNSPSAVAELENFDGIVTAFADSLYRETTRDVEPRPDITPPTVSEPEAYAINPHIGADQVWAAGYDGTGVTVGVVDTGVDFSVEGLVGTMDIGSDGLSTSFDPTGYGFVVSLYRANATVVNATAYLAYSSWNVLSYESNGKYYIDGLPVLEVLM
jgi:subtilisin family serine protease